MNHSKLPFLVLERVGKLEKKATIAYNFVANGESFQNLRTAILAWAYVYITPAELIGAVGDIEEWLIVVIAKDRRVGDSDGVRNGACCDDDGAVHVSLQLLARVVDDDPCLQGSGVGVEGRRDVRDSAMKAVRVCAGL